MRVHRILASALFAVPMLPLGPSDASAFDWARSVGDLQRYHAQLEEPRNPEQCVRYYRSWEARNRMPTSSRLKAMRACTAANEAKAETRVADTVRPERPIPFRPPVPTPLPAPVVIAPAAPR